MAGTTADKLAKLQQTKADFKTTMTDMGLDVTDELPFGDYPSILMSAGSMKKITVKIKVEFSKNQTPYGIFVVGNDGDISFVWGGSNTGTFTYTTYAGFPMISPRYISATSGKLTNLGSSRIVYDGNQDLSFDTSIYTYILGDSDVEITMG